MSGAPRLRHHCALSVVVFEPSERLRGSAELGLLFEMTVIGAFFALVVQVVVSVGAFVDLDVAVDRDLAVRRQVVALSVDEVHAIDLEFGLALKLRWLALAFACFRASAGVVPGRLMLEVEGRAERSARERCPRILDMVKAGTTFSGAT
jgi:hypothetical protein